jgi:hypothetical protein
MSYAPSPELRECCIAAQAGDHDAAKQVLKLYRYVRIAKEVKKGKPFSNRVRRAVDCLTAGYGSETWEIINEDGKIENLLQWPPPPPGTPPRLVHRFDD